MPGWRGKVRIHFAARWTMLGLSVYFSLHCHPALANPVGPQVVAGGAQIENAGSVMNIHQSTDRAVINWQGFSIAGHEVTNFLQPSASSAVLNRVTSGEVSQIQGALNANGQVYLINPAGIMVGNGAVVNVGSFIASTADVNDGTFMGGGPLNFVGATEAGIVNRGTIHANGGDVVLMAKTVKNEGTITAPGGTAGLLAGQEFYLKKEEPGAIGVKVGAGGQAVEKGVDNQGRIEAMRIQLEAQGNVYGLAVNQGGVLMATGVQHKGDGTIVLSAPGGKLRQAGTMLAVNANGSGGRLSVKAGEITVEAASVVTAAGSGATAEAKGGIIEIEAEGDVLLDGRLDVTAGDAAKGGRMVVTGKRVGVLAGTLDASGGKGGGEILFGGDYLGKNPAVRNAEVAVLMPQATLRADATESGDGGRVILWSDLYTGFWGQISVQGGAIGGGGGFIETSSAGYMDVFGSVLVGAPAGPGGTWLLDPAILTITGTASPAGYPAGFPPTIPYGSAVTTIAPAYITAALSTPGTAVVLQATSRIRVNQNIDFSASITAPDAPAGNYQTASTSSLTLQSAGDIIVNASIDIAGDITLQSNSIGAAHTGITTGDIIINSRITSQSGNVTITSLAPTTPGQLAGNVEVDSQIIGGPGDSVSITAENGNILLNANIEGYQNTALGTVNLTTGVSAIPTAFDGGFINQAGGIITATTINAVTQSSAPAVPLNTAPGEHGIPYQLDSYIYLGSQNEADNVSLLALGAGGLATYVPGTRPLAAPTIIFYRDATGVNIGTTTAPAPAASRGIATAGSVNIQTGPASATAGSGVTQTQPITSLAFGITAQGDVDLSTSLLNDVLYLAANTQKAGAPGNFFFTDQNGFNVSFAQTFWGVNAAQTNTQISGIRAGSVALTALDDAEANGIRLFNDPLYRMTADYQYTLLNGLPVSYTVILPRPGHIEARGDVTVSVEASGTGRFTLDEGIHLFSGMNSGLSDFSGSDPADAIGRGIVTITADNMTIGSDTEPGVAMNGLIMTGNINQAIAIDETSGVFLRPFGTAGDFARRVALVSPKANYNLTPDPGELQLSTGELQRINTSRLQVRSAFADLITPVDPAVDVRTSLSLNGLYDVTEINGLFPNLAGVNRLEFWASGGAGGNVQISADVSADANQAPMQIYAAATAADNSSGGLINVNAGLRSYGGYVALQGDNVNINAAINANNPANPNGQGLVAIFPGTGPTTATPATAPTPMNLGSKGIGVLGLVSSELALITAGTIQFGVSADYPMVLRPTSTVTGTYLSGAPSIWGVGNPDTLVGMATGTMTISQPIAGLTADTLALMADDIGGTGTAITQAGGAGIQVAGLFVAGTPGRFVPGVPAALPVSSPGTDYILNSTLNSFDRLGVALTTSIDQDAGLGRAGTPTGDLLIVNSKGFAGGNNGEVARTSQQWWQNLIRADANTSPLYTGIGLVAVRALSVTAAGPVTIYETLPTGVSSVTGQYMAHVNASPNNAVSMDRTEVGNQIGSLGGTGLTVGLAVDARQNALGSTGANAVWVAAARGLSISDLDTGVFNSGTGQAGILSNGGAVTLEGNALEILPQVTRTSGGTITIDTTGNGLAPAGARVVLRPATGENGFQDILGSGAYDSALENSPFAGAPVEINLGTGSTQVTVGGTGSGAAVIPLIDLTTGAITSYLIVNGGTNYTAGDPVTITPNGPGAGATVATVGTVDPLLGNAITSIVGGTGGLLYGAGFLDASQDTLFLSASALGQNAIRASFLEIGREGDAGTAAGKITISAALGGGGNAFSNLLQSLKLLSRGAVEDAGFYNTPLASPFGITLGSRGLAVKNSGAVALQGTVGALAVNATANNNVRFIDTAGGVSIGVVDGVSGITANTFYLSSQGGGIAQAAGAVVTASTGGVSLQAAGAIRLDQANNFNLVAASSPGNPIYLRSTGPMTVSSFAAGQPGSLPGAVVGINGSNVTLVAGAGLTQSGGAPITATTFLGTVSNGSDVLLTASDNNLGATPILAALNADGTLGNIRNLTLVNLGGVTLGSAGLAAITITDAGTGWTEQPNVTISAPSTGGTQAAAEAIMGLATIPVSDPGAGYQGAPVVTITGSGAGAQAVADVDLNPLSITYGQVLRIRVTNGGTGYGAGGPVSVTLSGGNPIRAATVAAGTVTLNLQRINMVNPGSGYTAPTVTVANAGGSITATTTTLLAGTGGYVPAGALNVLGGISGNLYASTGTSGPGGGTINQLLTSGFSVGGTTTLISNQAINLSSSLNRLQGAISVAANGAVTIRSAAAMVLGNFSGMTLGTGLADLTANLGGILELGSKLSIIQENPASSILAGGFSSNFYATETAASGGTPQGPVILSNNGNLFGGTVTAQGTRVVLRQSGNLNLGVIVASTSLNATSTGGSITLNQVSVGTGTVSLDAATTVTTGSMNLVGPLSVTAGGAVNLGAITQTGGDLSSTITSTGGSVSFNGASSFAGNLAVSAGTSISQSAGMTVSGTSSFSAATINLANPANDFVGAVSLNGGTVTLADKSTLNLGTSTVTGNLNLTFATGLTQSGVLTMTGASPLGLTMTASTAGANIDLSTQNNSLGGSVAIGAASASLQDFKLKNVSALAGQIGNLSSVSRDFTILYTATGYAVPNLSVGRNLRVEAGGPITDSGILAVTGTSSFQTTSGNSSITLDGASSFGQAVSLSTSGTGNATLQNVSGALALGTVTVGGNLLVSSSGAITDSGVLAVTGTSGFTTTAGNSSITLDSASSFGQAVSLVTSGTGNATLQNVVGGLDLGAVTVGGNLLVSSSGAITDSGVLAVTGTSGFTTTADNSSITLNSSSSFGLPVSLRTAGTGSAFLTGVTGALDLGSVLVGGDLTVSALGSIGDDASATITVAGAASLTTSTPNEDIDLQTLSVTGPISLNTSGATGNATILNNRNTVLGASTVGGNLSVTSLGGITDSGNLIVGGTTALSANGDILMDADNNLAGQVTIRSAQNLLLKNLAATAGNPFPILPLGLGNLTLIFPNSPILLPTLAISGNLNLTTGGAFTQSGPLTVDGTGTSTITAASVVLSQATTLAGNLVIQAGGSFSQLPGGILTVNGTGSSTLTAGTVALSQDATFGGSLNVTATSAGPGTTIQQTGGTLVTGGNTVFTGVGGTSISVGQAGNVLGGTVTFASSGGGNLQDVTVADTTALNLAGMTLDGSLTATGAGISQTGLFNVAGLTTLTAGADGSLSLGQANTFGNVTVVSALDVNLRNDAANAGTLLFPSISSNVRNLTLTFPSSGVTVPSSGVTIAGNLNLTAGGALVQNGALTVNGTGASAITAGTVVLSQNSAFGGSLNLTATSAGPGTSINQTGGTLVTGGNVTFTAVGGNSVNVGQAGNNFGGIVTFASSGGGNLQDVTVADSSGLSLAGMTLNGMLTATGTGITQTGAFSINGTTTLTAGTGAIVLNQNNLFAGPVDIPSAGSLFLVNQGNLSLASFGAFNVAGAVALTSSGGSVTVGGPLNVSGDVTLNGQAGVFLGGDISTGGGALTLNNLFDADIELTQNIVLNTTAGGSAGGNVLFDAAVKGGGKDLTIQAGTGNVSFTGTTLNLGGASFSSGGNVTAAGNFSANSVNLGSGLIGTVAFLQNLDTGSLTTAAGSYGVTISRSPNSIGGATTFANTGVVTLGGSGAVRFVGGVTATAPAEVVLLNNILTSGGSMVLGNIRVGSGVAVQLLPTAGNISIASVGGTQGATTGSLGLVTDAGYDMTLSGDATLPGNLTIRTDTLTAPGNFRSTGGGAIRLEPVTPNRPIWIGAGTPTSPSFNLGTLLTRTFTSGLVEIGSTTAGAITVAGNVNASANGFSGFNLKNGSGGLNFNDQAGQLLLPRGMEVNLSIGGNLVGNYSPTAVGLSLSAPGGRLNLLSAGTVTLGTDVGTVVAGSGLNPTGGFVLVNQSSLVVDGYYNTGSSDLLIQTLSGNIQLNNGASFRGEDLTIAPAGNFDNSAGSDPFDNTGIGRTLVYAYQSNYNQPETVNAGLNGFDWTFRVPQSIGGFGLGTYGILNPSQIPAGNTIVYAGNPVIPDLPMGTGLVEGFADTSAYTATVPTLGYPMPRAFESAVRLGFRSGLAKQGGVSPRAVGENRESPQPGDDNRERLRVRELTGEEKTQPKTEQVGQRDDGTGRLKVGQVPKVPAAENKTAEVAPTPTLRTGQARPVSLRFSEDYLPFEVQPVTESSERVSDSR